MNIFIRLLYSILIAAAVVTFVGVGINTFYPSPKQPDVISMPATDKALGPDRNQENDYQKAWDRYQTELRTYNRNISIILMPLAAAAVIGGLWLRNRSDIIGEGIALGGVGNSIYGVVAASIADNRGLRFGAVTLFLASVIVVVYFKFNEKPAGKLAKKRA